MHIGSNPSRQMNFPDLRVLLQGVFHAVHQMPAEGMLIRRCERGEDIGWNRSVQSVIAEGVLERRFEAGKAEIQRSMEGKAPLGVRLSSDCSTVGADTTYDWDFGDGWKSDLKNPTHDFQRPGTYQVMLLLHDGENISQSDPLTITVLP